MKKSFIIFLLTLGVSISMQLKQDILYNELPNETILEVKKYLEHDESLWKIFRFQITKLKCEDLVFVRDVDYDEYGFYRKNGNFLTIKQNIATLHDVLHMVKLNERRDVRLLKELSVFFLGYDTLVLYKDNLDLYLSLPTKDFSYNFTQPFVKIDNSTFTIYFSALTILGEICTVAITGTHKRKKVDSIKSLRIETALEKGTFAYPFLGK